MFERVVTISASTFARVQARRTASCRRLSASLGACDMDGVQEFFEGGDHRIDLWRRRRCVDEKLLRGLLEGQTLGGVGGRLRLDLAGQIVDGLFEIRIVTRNGERG